jgi:hypothetical protein
MTIFMLSPEILLVNVTLPAAPDGRLLTVNVTGTPMAQEEGAAWTTVEVVA